MEKIELTGSHWLDVRPDIEKWYLEEHRTAKWMMEELQRRNFKVT
jgi:hypothetical protein